MTANFQPPSPGQLAPRRPERPGPLFFLEGRRERDGHRALLGQRIIRQEVRRS